MGQEAKYKCFYCNKEYDKAEDVLMCQMKHERAIKKNNTESLNHYISGAMLDLRDISDGQTTFGELYEDKCCLVLSTFVLLSKEENNDIWYSDSFSDGSLRPGFFLIGYNTEPEDQITYLLPMRYRKYVESFGRLLPVAPPFKGHNTEDVRERIMKQIIEKGIKGED